MHTFNQLLCRRTHCVGTDNFQTNPQYFWKGRVPDLLVWVSQPAHSCGVGPHPLLHHLLLTRLATSSDCKLYSWNVCFMREATSASVGIPILPLWSVRPYVRGNQMTERTIAPRCTFFNSTKLRKVYMMNFREGWGRKQVLCVYFNSSNQKMIHKYVCQ